MQVDEGETEHDDHQPVAPGVHLHRFERHEENQQGNAGIAAKKRTVVPANGRRSDNHDQREKPTDREAGVRPP